MSRRDLFFWGSLAVGFALLAPRVVRLSEPEKVSAKPATVLAEDVRPIVADIDQIFRRRWTEEQISPPPPASDLAVLRRLTLALAGTIPALEEIRRFEALPHALRLDASVDRLLSDRRAADYLAERLARVFVGTEDGPLLLFRRRRFTTWLADAITRNRPYGGIVRDLIADVGLWTDHPATNFVTATFDQEAGVPDPERLASRVSRAFLGVRLDCARCHDHPFQPWKQTEFQGLAAHFGGVGSTFRGVWDGPGGYQPIDRKTKEPLKIEPRLPFGSTPPSHEGTPRDRLAAWIVDPGNDLFARATVNRIWAILLGRPLVEPIDDLPAAGAIHPALDRLAADFSTHGHDLHRLIRIITATEVIRLESTEGSPGAKPRSWEEREHHWASFPITMLRPEQLGNAVVQSASLTPIDANASWLVRLGAFAENRDFVVRYGDGGVDDEPLACGTIPQRLLLMNGTLVSEQTDAGLFTASARIAGLAPDDRSAVQTAYLTLLTRRPSDEELAYFTGRLSGTTGEDRKNRLMDLFWTLLNSTEFSWNH